METEYAFKILGLIKITQVLTDEGIVVSGLGRRLQFDWQEVAAAAVVENVDADFSGEHPEFWQVLPPGSKQALEFQHKHQRIMIIVQKRGKKKLRYLQIPRKGSKSDEIIKTLQERLGGKFQITPKPDNMLRDLHEVQTPLVIRILTTIGCFAFAILILFAWFVILYVYNELLPF